MRLIQIFTSWSGHFLSRVWTCSPVINHLHAGSCSSRLVFAKTEISGQREFLNILATQIPIFPFVVCHIMYSFFFCFLAHPLDLALWTVCLSTNSRSVKENKLSGQRKIPADVLSLTEWNVFLTRHARWSHLKAHCEYHPITTPQIFLIKPFSCQFLMVFINILNVPPFPHMPTTFVFQLSGKALGVEIKGGQQRNITSMKSRDWRNIFSGKTLLPWNAQGQRKIISREKLLQWKAREWRNIVRGGTLPPWNAQGQRKFLYWDTRGLTNSISSDPLVHF